MKGFDCGGGGEAGGRLIFENPFSCRPEHKSNYSLGLFFFLVFFLRDTEML